MMTFEQVAKVMDDVSRDAAMISVALRKRGKGTISTQVLADELTERWDRTVDNLGKAMAMINGREEDG